MNASGNAQNRPTTEVVRSWRLACDHEGRRLPWISGRSLHTLAAATIWEHHSGSSRECSQPRPIKKTKCIIAAQLSASVAAGCPTAIGVDNNSGGAIAAANDLVAAVYDVC